MTTPPNVSGEKEVINEEKIIMHVEDHLDLEKISQRKNEELLKIARLQGQWTSAKALQHQAQLLKTEGPIMQQFDVHIEAVENRLKDLGALGRVKLQSQPHSGRQEER